LKDLAVTNQLTKLSVKSFIKKTLPGRSSKDSTVKFTAVKSFHGNYPVWKNLALMSMLA
jgi:hypothetical protein